MKKATKFSVIIFGVCAVLWSIKTVLDIIDMKYSTSTVTFALDVLCAVLWIVAFVVQLVKYCKEKNE